MCAYLFGQDYSSAILDDKDVILFGFCYPGLGFAFVILLTFLFKTYKTTVAMLPLLWFPHLPSNSPNLSASNFDHLVHILLLKGLPPEKDCPRRDR